MDYELKRTGIELDIKTDGLSREERLEIISILNGAIRGIEGEQIESDVRECVNIATGKGYTHRRFIEDPPMLAIFRPDRSIAVTSLYYTLSQVRELRERVDNLPLLIAEESVKSD